MSEWRKLEMPGLKDFNSKKDFEEYKENLRCGICHKKLKNGDEYDLRSVQTQEEMQKYNNSKYTSMAVLVHKECVEK